MKTAARIKVYALKAISKYLKLILSKRANWIRRDILMRNGRLSLSGVKNSVIFCPIFCAFR
jgi:hypothetical protein